MADATKPVRREPAPDGTYLVRYETYEGVDGKLHQEEKGEVLGFVPDRLRPEVLQGTPSGILAWAAEKYRGLAGEEGRLAEVRQGFRELAGQMEDELTRRLA